MNRPVSPPASIASPRASDQRDVLLTPLEVGSWLKCSGRQVLRLPIPRLMIGKRKGVRFRAQDVAKWIEEQVRAARFTGRRRC